MSFYHFWRAVTVGLIALLFRTRIRGREHVPRSGVYVIAPSHRSVLDIPVAGSVTERRVRFLAKQELFARPFGRWVFTKLAAVPVDRTGNDRAALKAIEGALHEGEPVLIFPEGTRHVGPTLGHIHSGTSYAALKAGAWIVPVGIGGTERPFVRLRGWLPWLSRITVVVGPPIEVDAIDGTVKRSAIAAVDAELTTKLQACLDEAIEWSAQRVRSGGAREPGECI